MEAVNIENMTKAGGQAFLELSENSEAGEMRALKIPRDENGNPIGYTVDEIFDKVDHNLSEFYGVDFAKLFRMIKSGELHEDDVTDELLLSSQFKYEPYLTI